MKFKQRFPALKLERLQPRFKRWKQLKCCNKRNLESLVGQLHDASIIVRLGRTIIRRLIDLLKSALTTAQPEDSSDWTSKPTPIFYGGPNSSHTGIGLSMMQNPDVILTSDASGSWGCGAFYADFWFQLQWPAALLNGHITVNKLLPIGIATGIWGAQLANKFVLCWCDNKAVVHIIIVNTGVTGNPIRAYYDPCGSDPLPESIRRIGLASGSDPPPDKFY